MNKLSLILMVVITISVTGALLYRNTRTNNPPLQQKPAVISVVPTQNPPQIVDYTATFEIYTNGTKRIFTQSMYHHLSPDVYIENPNPNIVHIKKTDVTWNDFFKTLPFSITKDCLITGTKQTFCSNETQKLRFFLNEVENPNVLDSVIKKDDTLKITFGNLNTPS